LLEYHEYVIYNISWCRRSYRIFRRHNDVASHP